MINNQRGMTLIEIMIVLAIIGGVMGILIPGVVDNRKKAAVKETALIMNNIVNAANMMAQDCGFLPKKLDDLVVAPNNCKTWGPGPYLRKVPQDAWKHDFEYSSDGSEITLISFGVDGKEGGSNYDKDITYSDLEK